MSVTLTHPYRSLRGDLPAMWEGVTGRLSMTSRSGAEGADEECPEMATGGGPSTGDDEDSHMLGGGGDTERTALLSSVAVGTRR